MIPYLFFGVPDLGEPHSVVAHRIRQAWASLAWWARDHGASGVGSNNPDRPVFPSSGSVRTTVYYVVMIPFLGRHQRYLGRSHSEAEARADQRRLREKFGLIKTEHARAYVVRVTVHRLETETLPPVNNQIHHTHQTVITYRERLPD